MQRNIQIRCPRNHQISHFCCDTNCTSNDAIICNNNSCEYCYRHQNCVTIRSHGFIQNLMKKGGSSAEWKDPVVELYMQLMKKIKIDLQQYQSTKSQTGFQLQGDQGRLIKYLKQNEIGKVTQQLILKVKTSLNNQPIALRNQKLDQLLEQNLYNIQKILQDISSTWKNIDALNQMKQNQIMSQTFYRFNDELRKPKQTKVKQNNAFIEFDSQSSGCLALTTPSVQKNIKINFKLKNIYNVILCVCLKNIVKNNKFSLKYEIQGGVYGVSYNGFLLCHKNAELHQKNVNFEMKTNDIIEIEVNMEKKKIIFTNKTTKCQAVQMYYKQQNEDSMHFGVYGYKSAVEIIG